MTATRNPILGRIPPAPPDKGPLHLDTEIPALFFKDLPGIKDKAGWVRRNLPREKRVPVGRRTAYFEKDIKDYIASSQGRVAGSRKAAA